MTWPGIRLSDDRLAAAATLTAILVVGAVLRVFHLGFESVWFDEAYSIQLAQGSVDHILRERWVDIHPPLYYLSLHYWMMLAGTTESGVRLLSVLADLAAIVAAYAAARRLVGLGTALVTAALLAVSPFHVEYAQEARMYTLLGLLGTWSMAEFVRAFDPHRSRWRTPYVVATTLMLYTHAFSVFVLAAQAVSLGFVWWGNRAAFRRAWRPWLWMQATVLLLFSPWLVTLADQVGRVRVWFWIARPAWTAIADPIVAYSGSTPLAALLVSLAILGAVATAVWRPESSIAPLVVLLPWLVMPIVPPFVVSLMGSPIFLPKYTVAASFPFAILAAAGIVRLGRWWWQAAVATLLAALLTVSFQTFFAAPHKDGWRRATATLEAQARPNDVVLFYPWFNQIPFDYYHGREDIVRQPFVPDIQTPIPEPETIDALADRAVNAHPRFWFVVQQGMSRRTQILDAIGRRMTPVTHVSGQHVELFLFEKTR